MTEETKDEPKDEPKRSRSPNKIDVLEDRIDKLEAMVCKFAALAGQRNLPLDYDLKPWDPSPKDMRKGA
jgi:hypothetical protein